jgi:hypothetical protein
MKPSKILVDVGSSTIKTYLVNKTCNLKDSTSIHFKKSYKKEGVISSKYRNKLISYLKKLKRKYSDVPIHTYATSFFRKLPKEEKKHLIDIIYRETNLYLNIISHSLENYYLEQALIGRADLNSPVLLLNVGGGSTEIIVIEEGKVLERKNIKIGVGTILTKYPKINEQYSEISKNTIVSSVMKLLPKLNYNTNIAFYSGGELTYMQKTDYKLEDNTLFDDKKHPKLIHVDNFIAKNEDIFHQTSLQALEQLMPDNPKWMHGARACSALAEAVCKKYNIKVIIPSNTNLIDGVAQKEFRTVTISGSYRKFIKEINKIKNYFTKHNVEVLSPRFTKTDNTDTEFVIFDGEENSSPLELERYHLNSIDNSDVLIVCNPNGYVGASAFIEIGYAHKAGKLIIFSEEPEEFMLKKLPSETRKELSDLYLN